nr:MAG TPA: hypothetical protein [Caudoviricetes sp.]
MIIAVYAASLTKIVKENPVCSGKIVRSVERFQDVFLRIKI